MKRMLLITSISCFCFAQVFAGATPNKAPAAAPAQQTADNDEENDEEQKKLFAANEACPTMAPGKNGDKKMQPGTSAGKTDADQINVNCLLAGGSSPSQATPAQGQKPAAGQKKSDPAEQKQDEQQQLLA